MIDIPKEIIPYEVGLKIINEALKPLGDEYLLRMNNGFRSRWVDGVYVSSGIGGIYTLANECKKGMERGFDKISPFFIPMSITNLTAANIAIRLGAKGSCQCNVTACAGATNSIGEAYRAIKHGYEDMILAGGAESSITALGVGGFTSMKALSVERNPKRAFIPFDKERSGFVMGEGASLDRKSVV